MGEDAFQYQRVTEIEEGIPSGVIHSSNGLSNNGFKFVTSVRSVSILAHIFSGEGFYQNLACYRVIAMWLNCRFCSPRTPLSSFFVIRDLKSFGLLFYQTTLLICLWKSQKAISEISLISVHKKNIFLGKINIL